MPRPAGNPAQSSDTFADPSRMTGYVLLLDCGNVTRRMPRPEEESHDHIDSTILGFLRGERDVEWTEVSLITLHPRQEIKLVLKENADRYRTLNSGRFQELLEHLRSQGVALQVAYK